MKFNHQKIKIANGYRDGKKVTLNFENYYWANKFMIWLNNSPNKKPKKEKGNELRRLFFKSKK